MLQGIDLVVLRIWGKPEVVNQVLIGSIALNQDLAVAISQIHQFVLSLGREAMQFQDTSIEGHRLAVKVNDFSASVNQFLLNKACYIDFVLDLSRILTIASELNLSVLGYKVHKGTLISSDCIDKVTLLEKKAVQDDLSRQNFPDGCGRVINSTSDPEVLQEGNLTPGFALNVVSSECSLKELEQLKLGEC
ncbi:hypothetical protein L1049_023504 [Liquidambar formosana]|uniref:Uncharacterized protein n=1 Tax=Liquidambar formosana TaxID=63359 RepID=A0AAP0X3I7_LIQFO